MEVPEELRKEGFKYSEDQDKVFENFELNISTKEVERYLVVSLGKIINETFVWFPEYEAKVNLNCKSIKQLISVAKCITDVE